MPPYFSAVQGKHADVQDDSALIASQNEMQLLSLLQQIVYHFIIISYGSGRTYDNGSRSASAAA